eukprot:GDKI01001610.1.p1 GENE.GDKI01001610.1~~GDKI01001610.1.p1  ORF type:complete len:134 (+),score=33.56 GDKI01001610.1:36-404(+)
MLRQIGTIVPNTPATEAAEAVGSGRSLQEEEMDTGADETFEAVEGCCYDVGYGAQMIPVYSNFRDINTPTDCPISTRAGGATIFQAGSKCHEVQALVSGNGNGNETAGDAPVPVARRRLIRA